MEDKKFTYGEITTKKIGRLWQAITFTTTPFECETTMAGVTEEIAKQKLINFLEGKPYKHLDNL